MTYGHLYTCSPMELAEIFEEEMKDDPTPPATGCSIQAACKKDAGVEKDLDTYNDELDATSLGSGNQQAVSRHIRRLKHLRAHHDACERRYNKAHTDRSKINEDTKLVLHNNQNTMKADECSSDSDDTIDPTPPDVDKDSEDRDKDGVPELQRTESVFLTRKMLGIKDFSLPSSGSSEELYVPDSADETDDECSEEEGDSSEVEQHKYKKRKAKKKHSTNTQAVQPHKRQRKTHRESSSNDSSDVTVMMLQKKPNGDRLYNKKYHCVFCLKAYNKIARHLESKHRDKQEVARAMTYPKGSKERRIQLSLLRNQGNRLHNNKVLREGKGVLVPSQQSSTDVAARDYMHCINCEAYLKRKTLWRHMQRCQLRKKIEGLKPGKTRVQALCQYAQPVPADVNERFWKMVLNMHMDEVTNAVRREKNILKFGEHLFSKHGHDATKHEYIRQKMREAGRLVVQGHKHGKLKQLSDFFVPANFPHVIRAVKDVAGLNEETNTYKTPSLALKLGHNLKKIASIIECEAMIAGEEDVVHNVQMFKQICDTKWNECVSAQALRNLDEAKWNAPQLLPFAEDVKKMHQYLERQRQDFKKKLDHKPTKKDWAELARITLCEIILFNRRREGEVSKMPLNAFTLRDTSSTHPDIELSLSELERKLCKHLQRIEIRGKRGRKVPILLTPDVLASMELLVKTRRTCEVPDENQFMFGRPKALSYFRGSDVIRQVARSCGANHPEALSSTKLRKHLATMSKILNLKDNEMDDLAEFLGHDIRVHRQYYRLPEGTLQLAKISKVLMALERGQLSQFQGKNLDQINIDPQEKMPVYSDPSDSEADDDMREEDAAPFSPSPSPTPSPSPSPSASSSSGKSRVSRKSFQAGPNYPHPAKDDEMPLAGEVSEKCQSKKGSSQAKRKKWSDEEIQAVEETLMDCIMRRKVPGKAQCLQCINTSPTALQDRSWEAVKFYVKNRIDAEKRESLKQR
ncbi:uncharacterized protein LOC117809795 isoform X2 [Notolabrus celidotus]|uniref:uncharacterized protein LOC117809795 isoform X2 n=1 Tax=Notolabrus celidotus TaxID=1203425 RepID=UPI0014901FF9|nr:uncharacterized protein LOC117809795 isoform X2 [Notolabrus celidotus]